MGTSKRYNAVPVKDNCALFLSIPYFQARAIRRCHLNFSPANPHCHGNEFWDNIDYNSAPIKYNCVQRLFSPTPPTHIFGPRLPDGVIKICPMTTPVAMATNRSYSKTKLAAADIVT